jgi:protoporphyrinogen oxidase
MLKKYRYLILGAGPSGLVLANALILAGTPRSEIRVLEQQGVAGGLCRSEMVDGAPLDIGGGHFLDVKKKEVLDFIFQFMPREEWDLYDRVSKIRLQGIEVDHPLEANLWQLPTRMQADYIESIAQAGCVRGEEMPEAFENWIAWKLGTQIAHEYMLPYNKKIWSVELNQLGTYWLHKLPDVSFYETLLSSLERRSLGNLPAHGTFLYPKKFGYGEVWRRMGESLGETLVNNCAVEKIDLTARIVNDTFQAENIITTIPWVLWPDYCDLPEEILKAIGSLKNASIDVDYHSANVNSQAHWLYEPDESISYHRLLLRSNFIPKARGYWTETNSSRSKQTNGIRFHNKFSYPINTIGKPAAVKEILEWAQGFGIMGLGRWGRWEHMNSDVAVAEALQIAKQFLD